MIQIYSYELILCSRYHYCIDFNPPCFCINVQELTRMNNLGLLNIRMEEKLLILLNYESFRIMADLTDLSLVKLNKETITKEPSGCIFLLLCCKLLIFQNWWNANNFRIYI